MNAYVLSRCQPASRLPGEGLDLHLPYHKHIWRLAGIKTVCAWRLPNTTALPMDLLRPKKSDGIRKQNSPHHAKSSECKCGGQTKNRNWNSWHQFTFETRHLPARSMVTDGTEHEESSRTFIGIWEAQLNNAAFKTIPSQWPGSSKSIATCIPNKLPLVRG